MSDTLPSTHTAGDSTVWHFDAGACPPADGWAAKLVLVGTTRVEVACIAAGDQFAVNATSATTAAWPPGAYAASLVCTKGDGRASRAVGPLRVLADPLAAGTTARSSMTDAEAHLADLEAAYRAHLASGNAVVAEYRIGTRMKRFKDVADLLKAITNARNDVAREKATADLAAGISSRRRIVTRM